jgi:5-methylcytosine-specific restriction endonuclease McrA
MRSLYRKRAALKLQILGYLNGRSCARCGIDDLEVLEFDHIERKDKVLSVARMINRCMAWEDIQNELSKCQILCANCHKKKTLRETKYWKFLQQAMSEYYLEG